MKKILKKIIFPIVFLTTLLMVFSTTGSKKTEAASSNIAFGSNGDSIRIVYTNDLFVAEDFSNEITTISDVVGNTFFITVFVNVTSSYLDSLDAMWVFNSSQISSVESIVASDANAINAITGSPTDAVFYSGNMPGFMSTGNGRTGTTTIEGNANKGMLASTLAGSITIDSTAIISKAYAEGGKYATTGTYVLSKAKVTLKNNVSSFDLKADDSMHAQFNISGSGFSTSYDSGDVSVFNSSLGAGSSSSITDTAVTVTGNGETAQPGTLTSANPTLNFTVGSETSTATLALTVDGGKGSISGLSGATGSSSPYTVTLPSQRGQNATVTFTANAQDGTTQSYTINIKRAKLSEKALNSYSIAKSTGANDPLLTANTVTTPSTSNNINGQTLTAGSTYKIWVSAVETGVKFTANYTATGGSATLNGSSYTSGSTQTIAKSVGSFSLVITAEDGSTATYNFSFANIPDNRELTGVTVKNATLGSIAGATANINTATQTCTATIPYSDASGNVLNSVAFQLGASSGSTITYGTSSTSLNPVDSNGNTSAITLNNGSLTLYVRVTDNLTGEYKDWTINLTREGADNTTTLSSVLVDNAATTVDTDGAYKTSTKLVYSKNNCAITVNLPKSTSKWYFKAGQSSYTYDATKYSSGASGNITFDTTGTLQAGTFDVVIVVEAQNGDTVEYTVRILRDGANSDSEIDTNTLKIRYTYNGQTVNATATYNSATKTYTLDNNVPYKVNTLDINATLNEPTLCQSYKISCDFGPNTVNGNSGQFTTITIGDANAKNEYTFNITLGIVAQDGTPTTYTITGKREKANTDNTISTSSLAVTNETSGLNSAPLTGTWDSTSTPTTYTISANLPASTTSIGVTVTLSNTLSTLKINGVTTQSGSKYTYSIPSSSSQQTYTIPIVVTSEAGVDNTYNVVFTRNAQDTSNTVADTDIVLTDPNDANKQYTGSFTSSTSTGAIYEVTVPFAVTNLEAVVNNIPSLAKAYWSTESSVWNGQDAKTIIVGSSTTTSQIQKDTTFRIVSESGSTFTYTIRVNRNSADATNTATIKVFGATTGQQKNPYNPTNAISGHTYYQVKASVETDGVKFTVSDFATSSKVYFSQTSDSSGYIDWTSSMENTFFAIDKIYYFKVVPEAGASLQKIYTIHIEKADERDSDCTLGVFEVRDSNGDLITPKSTSDTFTPGVAAPITLTYDVPYGIGTISITADPYKSTSGVYKNTSKVSPELSFDVSTLTGSNTSKTFTYYVQAENESWSGVYKIIINRQAGDNKAGLTTLKVNGVVPKDSNGNLFTAEEFTSTPTKPREFYVNLGATYYGVNSNLVKNYANTSATVGAVTQAGNLATDKKELNVFTVTSEDGNTVVTYRITIYTADESSTLSALNVYDAEDSNIISSGTGNIATTPTYLLDSNGTQVYSFNASNPSPTTTATINYVDRNVFFEIMAQSSTAKVKRQIGSNYIDWSNQTLTLNTGNNTFIFCVFTEYDILSNATTPSATYTFNLEVKTPSNENRLDTFKAYIGGTEIPSSNITFSPDNENIIIQNVGNTSVNLKVDVTKKEATQKVIMPGTTTDTLTYTKTLQWASSTEVFNIVVYPENPSSPAKTYTVTVYSGQANSADNNDIGNVRIQETASTNILYNTVPSQTAEASAEVVNVAVAVTSLTIYVGLPGGSLATAHLSIKGPNDSSYSEVTLSANTYILALASSTTNDLVYMLECYAVALNSSAGAGDKYYIKVVVPKTSDTNTLDKIIIDGNPYDPGNSTNVTYGIPSGTTSVPFGVTPDDPASTVTITTPGGGNLTYTPNSPGALTGTVSGLNPGNNTVTVTVTPTNPNGTPKQYTVNIWVNENTKLDNLEVVNHTLNPVFISTTSSYDVDIAYATNSVDVKYTLPSTTDPTKVKVQYKIGTDPTLYSFNSSLLATVNTTDSVVVTVIISQNYTGSVPSNTIASSDEYVLNLKKATPSNDCELQDIYEDGNQITGYSTSTPKVLEYSRTKSYVDLTNITHNGKSFTLTSTGQASALTNNSYRVTLTQGQATTVTIKVQAENPGTSKEYKFILVAADKSKEVGNIELLNANLTNLVDLDNKSLVFNSATLDYETFTVANTIALVKVRITKPQYATLVINGTEISAAYGQTSYVYNVDLTNAESPDKAEVLIQINSEFYKAYGQNTSDQSDVYKLYVTRKPLDDTATLHTLTATTLGSTNLIDGFVADQAGADFIIQNVGSVSSITINATPTVSTSTVTGTGTFQLSSGSDTSNQWGFQFIVKCTSEAGNYEEYIVKVFRGAFNASDDNEITGIELIDSNNVYYIANSQITNQNPAIFNPATGEYEITIPYGAQSYTINASKYNGSPAKIYITDGSAPRQTSSLLIPITQAMYGQTITHEVYAVSENGQTGTKYTVKVTLTPPNDDNTLKSLTADGEELLDPTDPDKTVFNITRPNSATSINIQALINDPTAKISSSSDLGNLPLAEGLNTFTVVVRSEAGNDKTYKINVTRAYADPELLDLGVNGERLLDAETGKAVSFDPDVTEYAVRLIFSHETADIYALSSDVTDVITGTGLFNVAVGTTTYIVTIINLHGNKVEYSLIITRLPSETTNANLDTATISMLDATGANLGPLTDKVKDSDGKNKVFNEEFVSTVINYGPYRVSNKVTALQVQASPQIANATADYDKATVNVYGADSLKVGKNNVVILVTAPDGETTKAYVVEVIREELAFEVDEEKIKEDGFTVEEILTNGEYKINIGKKKTSEIDFYSYIKDLNPDNQVLSVEILSDISANPNEVLVKVTTDNDETQIVKFTIESSGNPSSTTVQDFIPLFIILGIVIILLTCILIAVNRDKYGKITRKADRKADKEEKATK